MDIYVKLHGGLERLVKAPIEGLVKVEEGITLRQLLMQMGVEDSSMVVVSQKGRVLQYDAPLEHKASYHIYASLIGG